MLSFLPGPGPPPPQRAKFRAGNMPNLPAHFQARDCACAMRARPDCRGFVSFQIVYALAELQWSASSIGQQPPPRLCYMSGNKKQKSGCHEKAATFAKTHENTIRNRRPQSHFMQVNNGLSNPYFAYAKLISQISEKWLRSTRTICPKVRTI